MNNTKKRNVILFAVIFAILTLTLLVFVGTKESNNVVMQPVDIAKPVHNNIQTSLTTSNATTQLTYLIEEEKLAYDVYSYMYQKYGAKVFGNILKSEAAHQDRVLVLLNARNIDDPRSPQAGVFKDVELQKLYNELIAQGSVNAQEAYKVGVIIEEKDISDLSDMLAQNSDEDIVQTLESLRSGSENHLRAFNKQL
jgi:hypothetical protein